MQKALRALNSWRGRPALASHCPTGQNECTIIAAYAASPLLQNGELYPGERHSDLRAREKKRYEFRTTIIKQPCGGAHDFAWFPSGAITQASPATRREVLVAAICGNLRKVVTIISDLIRSKQCGARWRSPRVSQYGES